ncbi:MAG: CDP-glycerol glycerophosphotransferase family protein [Treponema sp.]|nr:CDP-glycerol glycerophosphotransferase family protein [Treponema sp.]
MTKIIYGLFFSVFFVTPLWAYIDPGTGSMLFSFLTGIAVTVFFFVKNVILKMKSGSLFATKHRGKTVVPQGQSLVIYSEGKQYWNVFKPVLEELAKRGILCMYYTSGEDDPGLAFTAPESLIQKSFIGKGNVAYRALNFLEADICLMTTPGLDVFQLKRSPGVKHYAHILHTVTDATTYRLFGLDYYDSVLLTGEYQKQDIRKLEEKRGTKKKALFVVGCTYLDVIAEKKQRLPPSAIQSSAKTVLVAPSWGENGILKRYGMRLLEPLARSSFHVILRPHPQSMLGERDTVEKLQKTLGAYPNVEWNFDAENLAALARADVLISDFSGVIFDYAFLFNRPVLYPRFEFDLRPYDAADIETEAWVFRAIREIGIPIDETRFADIAAVLDRAISGAIKNDTISKLKAEAYMYAGEAGKRVVDVLGELRYLSAYRGLSTDIR